MPGDNPLIVGGVHIYQPADAGKKCLFKKAAVKVLPKEGDLNVVRYKGMIIKFPDQQPMQREGREITPFIAEDKSDGFVEIMMQNAEVKGSNKPDKVRSYCRGSVFDFEKGGADTIEEWPDNTDKEYFGLFHNQYYVDKNDHISSNSITD